jgi:hypothetical protein
MAALEGLIKWILHFQTNETDPNSRNKQSKLAPNQPSKFKTLEGANINFRSYFSFLSRLAIIHRLFPLPSFSAKPSLPHFLGRLFFAFSSDLTVKLPFFLGEMGVTHEVKKH